MNLGAGAPWPSAAHRVCDTLTSEMTSILMFGLEHVPMSRTRTTLALPTNLLRGVDHAVRQGLAASRNEFLAMAIRHELERIQRAAVDREFEAMADDPVYHREAEGIAQEYQSADWEALRVAEDDS